MNNENKPTKTTQNETPAPNLNDDFLFSADYADNEDEEESALIDLALAGKNVFANHEHEDDDDDNDEDYTTERIGCEDCVFGLCDCGYDFD
jgi:hypothetical protein